MLDAALLQWVALALLNAIVALLLLQVRPRTAAYGWLAVLFATNALATPLIKLAGGAGEASRIEPWFSVGAFLEISTIVPLFVVSLLLPSPRASPRTARVLYVVAAGLYAATAIVVLVEGGPRWAPEAASSVALGLALRVVLVMGIALFMHDLIESRGAWRRSQSRLYLAAFLLPLAALAPLESSLVNAGLVRVAPALYAPLGPQVRPGPDVMFVMGALDLLAILAPLAILVTARLRGNLDGGTARFARETGIVALVLAIGVFLGHHVATLDLAWMFARPALFVTSVFAFRVVDWGRTGTRWLLPGALLAAFASLLFTTISYGAARGIDGATSVAIGLVLGVGLLVGVAWTFVHQRGGMGSADAVDIRRQYRRALEAALDEKEVSNDAQRALRDLRSRLGLRDSDHADAVAELSLAHGAAARVSAITGGRYRLVRPLGSGGFGRVDLAWDERTAKDVVLKRALTDDPRTQARLAREARILARLSHAHIVAIHDILEDRDGLTLVMEYVPGGSLEDRLRSGTVKRETARRWTLQVLDALAVTHAHGVVHRDIKPSNILLTSDGRALIADFGIAKLEEQGTGTREGFTRPGQQPGTMEYMAPEQVRGTTVDHRTDLYAVSALLYRCVAGKPYLPFRDLAEYEARLAIVQRPPRIDLPGLHTAWTAFFARGLSKDVAGRFSDATEMGRALAALPGAVAIKRAKGAPTN